NNNINLQNSAGTIKLTLPKDSKFNLDAYTTAGDIDCDFPIAVTGTNHERSMGQVGESNNTVKIRNTAGNIEINK
ncbi:MAG: DUF4097 family beta strand repeat-containing protein, partial [Clostridium sp.]|nr:DUF4097 family beta strand repeat-containing protein [Clostridium sp.]